MSSIFDKKALFHPVLFFIFAGGAALLFYFPNMGGSGLRLPFNPLIYTIAAAGVLIIWLQHRRGKTLVYTPTFRLLLVGAAILTIPVCYTRAVWLPDALWRVGALLGGLLFYFSWLQMRLDTRLRAALLYTLLLVICLQAALATIQIFAPSLSWTPPVNGRVYGIFQQPNVLGSLIATGLSLASALLLLPAYELASRHRERWRTLILGTVSVLLAAMLVWIQSRAAWLGAAFATLLLLGLFWKPFPARCLRVAFLLLGGTALGIVSLYWLAGSGLLRDINHVGSNLARVAILRITLAMIALRPLLGWGYGGFEFNFQHLRIQQDLPLPGGESISHPHNEILLWWAEGGLIALTGMVFIIGAGIRLLRQALHHDHTAFGHGRQGAGEAGALFCALLPLLIHTQLEYPFALSAAHWLLFLLLAATLDKLSSNSVEKPAPRLSRTIGTLLPVASIGCITVMLVAFQGGLILTQAERGGLQEMQRVAGMSPLASAVLHERKTFDLQVHALLAYNRTHDARLLESFVPWAEGYLQRRVDANVYASLIAILDYQNQQSAARRYRSDAARLFPQDPRFAAALTASAVPPVTE